MSAKDYVVIVGNPYANMETMAQLATDLYNRGYIPIMNMPAWPISSENNLLVNFDHREKAATLNDWIKAVAQIVNLVVVANVNNIITEEMEIILRGLSAVDKLYIIDPGKSENE